MTLRVAAGNGPSPQDPVGAHAALAVPYPRIGLLPAARAAEALTDLVARLPLPGRRD
jgi:hypothetical protein